MASYDSSLKINPIAMQSAANKLDIQRSIIENCFESIFQDAAGLKSCWEGDSADAYHPMMEKLSNLGNEQSAAALIVRKLRKYSSDLDAISCEHMRTEAQIEEQTAALPKDVFGG